MLSQGAPPVEPFWRALHHLEHFHMTFRRTDWNRWEDNKPLVINPYRQSGGAPSLEEMRADMHTTMVEGRQPDLVDWASWITMFRAMRNLRRLDISFETSEDKRDEMEEIVAWARTWRFAIMGWRFLMGSTSDEPVAHLVADDSRPVRRMSWRGLRHHWSNFCPSCGSAETRPDCPYCLKKQGLQQQDKGPRLLVWTLSWRPEPVDCQETEGGERP